MGYATGYSLTSYRVLEGEPRAGAGDFRFAFSQATVPVIGLKNALKRRLS
jgi:hypothetical protein